MSLISRLSSIIFAPIEDPMMDDIRYYNDRQVTISKVKQWMRENADFLPRPTVEDDDAHEWMDRYEDEALRLYATNPIIGVSVETFYDAITLDAKHLMFFPLMK